MSSLLNHSGGNKYGPCSSARRKIFLAYGYMASPSDSRSSTSMPDAMSISILRRRERTCSSVCAERFRDRREWMTSVDPSTSELSASMPVSGGSSTSFSYGYWARGVMAGGVRQV